MHKRVAYRIASGSTCCAKPSHSMVVWDSALVSHLQEYSKLKELLFLQHSLLSSSSVRSSINHSPRYCLSYAVDSQRWHRQRPLHLSKSSFAFGKPCANCSLPSARPPRCSLCSTTYNGP